MYCTGIIVSVSLATARTVVPIYILIVDLFGFRHEAEIVLLRDFFDLEKLSIIGKGLSHAGVM